LLQKVSKDLTILAIADSSGQPDRPSEFALNLSTTALDVMFHADDPFIFTHLPNSVAVYPVLASYSLATIVPNISASICSESAISSQTKQSEL
jgi:hypothetical protein